MPIGSESGKWLECNGQAVDPAAYPKLAALMSNTPNYCGIFLRGHGSVTSNHYGTVLHQSGNLGELQGDASRNIHGTWFEDTIFPYYSALISSYYASYNHTASGGSDNSGMVAVFDSANVVPTAAENRPINKAVIYLIKAK